MAEGTKVEENEDEGAEKFFVCSLLSYQTCPQ
jgi:hypothetical protein